MVSCCNRRLYKGNSYEICLPITDSGVTSVRFYTSGDMVIEKEGEIVDDTMCFELTKEELDLLPDGVLRYSYEGFDSNTEYVIVTPADYSGSTLDDLLEDAFDSGYTAGQEDCSGDTCNLQSSKTVYLGGFEWSYDPGTEGPWARAPRYMISGSPVHISADTGYDGLEEIQLTGYFHPTEAYDDGYGKGFNSGYTSGYSSGYEAGQEDCSGETINNQPWKTIDLWQLNKDDTSKFELLYSDKLGYYYTTKPGVEVEATYDSGYTGLQKAGALFRLMPTEAINLGYASGYTAGQEDCDCEDAFDSGYTAGFLAGKRLCNPFTITNLSQDTPGEIELVLHVHRTGDTGCTTRLRTSTDGTNWSDELEYSGGTFTIQPGQSLMFDGNSNEHWYPTQRYLFGGNLFGFRQSENNDPSVFFEVSGDIMTLMKQGNTMKNSEFEELFDGFSQLRYADGLVLPDYTATRCYENMFSNCTSLVSTPELPATALTGDYVYLGMFSSCSSLTKAPELPATVLAPGCYMNMFSNCTGLIEAPELKATGMASQCYSNMFDSCTSLTTAPELPATVMAPSCYMFMFGNCLSLTTPPELPATTLAESCYYGMFSLCRAFTTAPELPATVMAKNCYNYMFISCTGLTQAPELPATTLAEGCYEQMFSNCQSLNTSMEVLPATTLQPKCYKKMFEHCYSLLTTPELPASTLADNCYELMFYQCTGITSITCNATDITATDCTKDWVKVWTSDASPKTIQTIGTFYSAPSMVNTWVVGSTSGVPINWTIETQPGPEPQSAATAITITVPQNLKPGDTGSTSVSTSPQDAPTNLSYSSSDNSVATVDNNGNITAVGTGTTNICVTDSISQITECAQLTINNPGPGPQPSYSSMPLTFEIISGGTIGWNSQANIEIEYSVDCGSTWSTFNNPISVNAGDMVQFRGTGRTGTDSGDSNYSYFSTSGALFNACGNLYSLLDKTNYSAIDDLTQYGKSTFRGLFRSNSGLTSAENLIMKANTLSESCYYNMFRDCTELTTSPELPARVLVTGCYWSMFEFCQSLRSIRCYAVENTTSITCLSAWVAGTPSGGTFYKHPDATWNTSAEGIPYGWTVVDIQP